MGICELMDVEEGGWHFPQSVLRFPVLQHEEQFGGVGGMVGWLHVPWRKHVFTFTLPGCYLHVIEESRPGVVIGTLSN